MALLRKTLTARLIVAGTTNLPIGTADIPARKTIGGAAVGEAPAAFEKILRAPLEVLVAGLYPPTRLALLAVLPAPRILQRGIEPAADWTRWFVTNRGWYLIWKFHSRVSNRERRSLLNCSRIARDWIWDTRAFAIVRILDDRVRRAGRPVRATGAIAIAVLAIGALFGFRRTVLGCCTPPTRSDRAPDPPSKPRADCRWRLGWDLHLKVSNAKKNLSSLCLKGP